MKLPQGISSNESGRQSGGERVRESKEQRETDTDHGDRVHQRRDDEHLDLQHRRKLGLARGTFEEPAAENTEADGGAKRAHAEDDSHGEHGHALYMCKIFHSTLLDETDAQT